jgi:hypothetical protein
MNDPNGSISPVWRGIQGARKLAAWVSLAAAVSVAIAIAIIYYKYPYAYYVPSPPAMPRWVLIWRNGSIVTGLVASLVSLPKWQSLVAIPSIIFLVIFGMATSD